MIRVNLLGQPRTRRKARPAVTFDGGKALIILLIVVVGVAGWQYLEYRKLQDENARLAQQISQLELERADLGRIRAEYDTFSKRKDLLTSRINIIEALKKQQSGPVQLLEAVGSAVTGDNTVWLTSFDKVGPAVSIQGFGLNVKSVADFLTRLQSTKEFSDVNLKETVQSTTTKEATNFQFTITAQMPNSTPGASGAPGGGTVQPPPNPPAPKAAAKATV